VASGLIYYPKKRKPKGVIIIYPFFKTKGMSGTDVRYSVEGLLIGLGDYVCMIPDGIGLVSVLISHIYHSARKFS